MGAAVDDRLGHPRTGVPTFFIGTHSVSVGARLASLAEGGGFCRRQKTERSLYCFEPLSLAFARQLPLKGEP